MGWSNENSKKLNEHLHCETKDRTVDAVETIKSFLEERKQFVQLNTHSSEILLTGPVSTVQGSVMSGLLYCIFILDMAYVGHSKKHMNNSSYYNCKKPNINTFVDDCFSNVETYEEKNLWKMIT